MSIISQEGCLPFGPSSPTAHLLLALYLEAQRSSSLPVVTKTRNDLQ